jgi:hypothetical protein
MPSRFIAALAALALLGACKPMDTLWNDIYGNGTIQGAETCMKQRQSDLITDRAVRRTCIEEFEVSLSTEEVDRFGGKGWVTKINDEVVFKAGFTHDLTDWVVTRVEVQLSLKEAETDIPFGGKDFSVDSIVWIEAHTDGTTWTSREVENAPTGMEDIPWCRPNTTSKCLNWMITDAKGLKI